MSRLEAKLAGVSIGNPFVQSSKRNRRRGGGRQQILPIADRQVAEAVAAQQDTERNVQESLTERRIVGKSQFGMRPLSGSARPDQIDFRLLGRTPEGRAWALEALHPCGEWQGAGLPDTYTSAVCVFQLKGEVNIYFDVTLFSTAPTTNSPTWSVQVLFPPIPEIQALYRIRHDASATWSRWSMIRWPTTLEGATMVSSGYSESRITSKGETVTLNAPDLANQGRIIIGQRAAWMTEDDETPVALSTATPPVPREFTHSVHHLGIHYLENEDNLVQICSSAYQEEAKRGAYIVHKFTNPLMGYQFKHSRSAITINENGFLYPINATQLRAAENDSDTSDGFANGSYYTGLTLPPNLDQDERQYGYGSSDPSDMTMAEMFIINIAGGDVATTGTNIPTSSATVRIKTRQTVEAHASFLSPSVVYARAPPLWDQEAVNAVVRFQETQPDAYPECYNSFGSVMGKVFGFLKQWAKPFVSAAGLLPVPYANVISQVANEGIDQGNSLFNGSMPG